MRQVTLDYWGNEISYEEHYRTIGNELLDWFKELTIDQRLEVIDSHISDMGEIIADLEKKINEKAKREAEYIKRRSEEPITSDGDTRGPDNNEPVYASSNEVQKFQLRPAKGFLQFLEQQKMRIMFVINFDFKMAAWCSSKETFDKFYISLRNHGIITSKQHELMMFFNYEHEAYFNVPIFDLVVIFETLIHNECITESAIKVMLDKTLIACNNGKTGLKTFINKTQYDSHYRKIDSGINPKNETIDSLKCFDKSIMPWIKKSRIYDKAKKGRRLK